MPPDWRIVPSAAPLIRSPGQTIGQSALSQSVLPSPAIGMPFYDLPGQPLPKLVEGDSAGWHPWFVGGVATAFIHSWASRREVPADIQDQVRPLGNERGHRSVDTRGNDCRIRCDRAIHGIQRRRQRTPDSHRIQRQESQ